MRYLRTIVIVILTACIASFSSAQQIQILTSGSQASLRGLSVVDDRVAWVSGSQGAVGKTTNGGEAWTWIRVAGFEDRDFRDIEAFDAVVAVIMAVGEPALILKTIDGGKTWKKTYENAAVGMFLDAMEFWNEDSGIVIGDPMNGKFFIARTFDGGSSWKEIPEANLPVADSGEACFAASGANIRAYDRDEACFVSGGLNARFFWKGPPVAIPFLKTGPTAGGNAIAVRHRGKRNHYVIAIGGDFNDYNAAEGNCALSADGGKTWIKPDRPPFGYRSCVEFISGRKWMAAGITGVDISLDDGKNWKNIDSRAFHVCRRAKKGKAVFLAGSGGRLGKLQWR